MTITSSRTADTSRPAASLVAGPGSAAGRSPHAGLRSYLAHLMTFRWRAAAVLCVFVLANALLAVVPIFVGRFVAALAAVPVDTGAAYQAAALLICCGIGHDLSWRSGELLWVRLILARGYDYENLVFDKVITQPYPYFVGAFTGKISSYVGTLGREYREFLSAVYWEFCEQLVRVPALAVIMFTVNVPTGCAFTVSLLMMLALGRLTISRVAAEERNTADTASDLDGRIIDVIANFVAVKSFGREGAESARVRAERRGVLRAATGSYRWNIVYFASMSLVVRYLVGPGTILLNLHLFLAGDLTLAQLTTFLAALAVFSDYIWNTVWLVSQLNLRFARVEEAYHYLFGGRDIVREDRHQQPTAHGRPAAPERPDVHGASQLHKATQLPGPVGYTRSLGIHDLRFAYPDEPGRPVLDGITLEIARNEKIGIVGQSGSGKSTLLKLLLGYYPLPAGTLALDGTPIDDRQLAGLISYVPQDVTLFHRSIRDNIVYGSAAGVTDEQVITAARRAHAHEFVSRTNQGYDTLVGERGIRLSTGQRQRIALARAFLGDAPILILDEATSALDSESERLVQDALEDLWATRTVIAIAHRLSTLLTMDRIVVLDGGRIAEQGTHEALLELGGRYDRLWRRQSGGFVAVD
ncbi:ABC transporter ATP-binding protein/permease [Frankia sp. Mgl5]|uniref:ABC transporter ATP-binding protein n=1 Tax=Frankia sp. Mgl5 TaxID=2933793 RepID=UPI00200CC7E9|nr:ABC transporter ATP-binding protein [Frankia sp. Mgl5]MCK9926103.1 ABC transporter ATP-binding protein/permease [Frankia sp. Mgl5]